MLSEIFHRLNTNILPKQKFFSTNWFWVINRAYKDFCPLLKKILIVLSRAHLNNVSRMVAHIKVLIIMLAKRFLSPLQSDQSDGARNIDNNISQKIFVPLVNTNNCFSFSLVSTSIKRAGWSRRDCSLWSNNNISIPITCMCKIQD